jgi:hypothetical protein
VKTQEGGPEAPQATCVIDWTARAQFCIASTPAAWLWRTVFKKGDVLVSRAGHASVHEAILADILVPLGFARRLLTSVSGAFWTMGSQLSEEADTG